MAPSKHRIQLFNTVGTAYFGANAVILLGMEGTALHAAAAAAVGPLPVGVAAVGWLFAAAAAATTLLGAAVKRRRESDDPPPEYGYRDEWERHNL